MYEYLTTLSKSRVQEGTLVPSPRPQCIYVQNFLIFKYQNSYKFIFKTMTHRIFDRKIEKRKWRPCLTNEEKRVNHGEPVRRCNH